MLLFVTVLILCCHSFISQAVVSIDLAIFWQAVIGYGGKVTQSRERELASLFEKASQAATRTQLTMVNHYFRDNVTYKTDDIVWRQSDYWASPAEFLAKELGDCEDYAIAKYVFLLRLGVPEEKLRLIYVKAKIGGRRSTLTQAHMVLGYYDTPGAQPLILDSLIAEVLPARERTDLIPVFSFNSSGIWSPGQENSVGSPSARLSRWRGVLEKIRAEGISES